MKKIRIKLKGISPLMMNRFDPTNEKLDKLSKEEQCKKILYIDGNKPYVPAYALWACLGHGAKYTKKGRGTRQLDFLCSCSLDEEKLYIDPSDWTIDEISVVNINTKGRMMKYRPKWNEWEITATLNYDEKMFSEKEIKKIVEDAGMKAGLLERRPQKKGTYGRFMITNWENIN